MYNSRPRNYKGGFAVPENYSGNAFVDETNDEVEENIIEETEENKAEESITAGEDNVDSIKVAAVPQGQSRFGLNVGRLFRGGIGFEELLIIALILLIAQNDNNDDVIVLLALLLFIS